MFFFCFCGELIVFFFFLINYVKRFEMVQTDQNGLEGFGLNGLKRSNRFKLERSVQNGPVRSCFHSLLVRSGLDFFGGPF